MEIAANLIVKGRVQGVGFRYFVYERATALGLTGFVHNCFNGEVEIEAQGDRSMVEELIKDIKVGPRSARVADVMVEWKNPNPSVSTFSIR